MKMHVGVSRFGWNDNRTFWNVFISSAWVHMLLLINSVWTAPAQIFPGFLSATVYGTGHTHLNSSSPGKERIQRMWDVVRKTSYTHDYMYNIHWKGWCWSSNTLATWCKEPTHWKTPWCWERLRAGEGGNRGWDVRWHYWLNGLSLSKLWEIVKDRGTWRAVVYGVAKSQKWVSDWTTNNKELIFNVVLKSAV